MQRSVMMLWRAVKMRKSAVMSWRAVKLLRSAMMPWRSVEAAECCDAVEVRESVEEG